MAPVTRDASNNNGRKGGKESKEKEKRNQLREEREGATWHDLIELDLK